MKISFSIENFNPSCPMIVTMGVFDGVHHGHQQIINLLNQKAKQVCGESLLVTFYPHPRYFFETNSTLKSLSELEEKVELLASFGLQNLIIQPFNLDFSKLDAETFVRDYLVKHTLMNTLIIGHDHHFGKNRTGDFNQLKKFSTKYGFDLAQIPAIKNDQIIISSTKIRNALLEGDINTANTYLGYRYFLQGEVITGDQLGRTIGFPTANLMVSEDKLIPKNGVYGVTVTHNNTLYDGMMNIGTRPTLKGSEVRLEVNIFDFKDDIYNQTIRVNFFCRIRDEQKFKGIDALVSQLKKDESFTRNYLSLQHIKNNTQNEFNF